MAQEILQNDGDLTIREGEAFHEKENHSVRIATEYVKVSWESVLIEKGYPPSPVMLYEYPYQCLGCAGENVFLVVSQKSFTYDMSVLKAKSVSLHVSCWNGCAWGPLTEKQELSITIIASTSDIHFKEDYGSIFMKTSCFHRVQV